MWFQDSKAFNKISDMEQTKICGVCGKTLPISEFSKNSKAADGLSYRCNTCKKHGLTKTTTSNRKSVDISCLSDEALCGELRRRGFTGELSYRKTISI